MTRKAISEATKAAAVKRVLEGKRDAKDEARRLNVTAQAVRSWVRAEERAHPRKAAPPGEPPRPPIRVTDPSELPPGDSNDPGQQRKDPPEGDRSGDPGAGDVNQERLKAANEISKVAPEGNPSNRIPTTTPPPGAPEAAIAAAAADDENVTLMAGNTIMNWATKLGTFGTCLYYKTDIEWDDKLEKLARLSDEEKAGLKPCAAHVAPIVREWTGGTKEAALAYAAQLLASGLLTRTMAIRTAVKEAVLESRKTAKAQENSDDDE